MCMRWIEKDAVVVVVVVVVGGGGACRPTANP